MVYLTALLLMRCAELFRFVDEVGILFEQFSQIVDVLLDDFCSFGKVVDHLFVKRYVSFVDSPVKENLSIELLLTLLKH